MNAFENNIIARNYGLSCYIMKKDGDVLTCFYILYDDDNDKEYFRAIIYKKINLLYLEDYNLLSSPFESSNIKYLKSDINSDRTKVLFCLVFSKGENNCFNFDINDNSLTLNYFNCNQNICNDKYYGLNVQYFSENDEFIFSCSGNNRNISLCIFNNFFEYSYKKVMFKECENIEGYSTIYSIDEKDYYIISNDECNGILSSFQESIISVIEEEEEEEKQSDEEEKEKEEEQSNEEEEKEEEQSNEEEEKEEEQSNEEEEEKIKFECMLEKCQKCNDESQAKNLCIKCNNIKGYYPLNISFSSENHEFDDNYIDCVNNKTKPPKFFYNSKNNYFEQCFETCASCEYGGNYNNNNCTSCEVGYIIKPGLSNLKNCIIKCPFYYYIYYGKYKCTSKFQCPKNYNLFIKEKEKCIHNCFYDDIYKYQYNGECLKSCPTYTNNESNTFICKDINKNICSLSERELIILDGNITDSDIEVIAQTYTKEFNYTDNHVSIFKDNNYEITFYKNKECVSHLKLNTTQIDFGDCYEKVKNNYSINGNLVLAIIDQKKDGINYPKMFTFSMYEPVEGDKLQIKEICRNDTIILYENLLIKLDSKYNYNFIMNLIEQNIDIFNLSSNFYTDICFHFDSPIDKDITLKDRILIFFPNITLCENDCSIKGVNTTSMRAICECKFNNLIDNDNILINNILYKSQIGQIKEFMSLTNIEIIRCFKGLLNYKYFTSCIGGYIIISFIIIQIVTSILYFRKSLYPIRKYILDITDKYISYLSNLNKNNNIFEPSKRKASKYKSKIGEYQNNIKREYQKKLKKRTNSNQNNLTKKKSNNKGKNPQNYKIIITNNINNSSSLSNSSENVLNSIKKKYLQSKKSIDTIKINNTIINGQNDENSIDQYLDTEIDDMVFEEVIKKDKRKFCVYFSDKLKTNLIVINTFVVKEPFKPRTIKFLLFILDIDLYLFINGLLFNEDFVSEIFHSTKEEHFFSFIPRTIDRCFYTTIVGIIVNYIIEFFFIDEKIIKGIFKREKNNIVILKYGILQVTKNIFKRFIYFIILSFVFTFFSLYYIFCFNYIYFHMQYEWIKSSIFIIIIMQILSILIIFLESVIRFMSFLLKSEKIFKISLFLS